MPLKVLHVISSLDRRNGGPAFALVELAISLKENGHTVGVAFNYLSQEDNDNSNRLESEGIATYKFENVWSSYRFGIGQTRWANNLAKQFDVIHIHGVFEEIQFCFAKAALALGIPYILRPFGVLSHYSLAQKKLKKRVYLYLRGNRLIEKSAIIHLVSKYECEQLGIKVDKRKTRIIPNGTRPHSDHITAIENSGENTPRNYWLYLGRIHKQKGIDLLLRAFALTQKKIERLIIAGGGSYRLISELQDLAKSLSIEAHVNFVGEVYGDTKALLLHGASGLALPSEDENFANVILEAWSYGIPVVTSERVGLSEVVSKELLGSVCPRIPKLFAEQMLALNHLAEDIEFNKRAKRFVSEHFNWRTIANTWATEYKCLVVAS